MSFVLMAAIVAAASAAGAAFGRRSRRVEPAPVPTKPANENQPVAPTYNKPIIDIQSKSLPIKPKVVDDAQTFARFPLALGDVVSFDRQERWLAGALVARDGSEVVGVLFLAPEGTRLEAVAAFPAPRREIFWMSPIDVEAGLEPPTSMDFGGVVMQRRVRLPVTISRAGQGSPQVGETAVWAEYEASAGARAVLIRGQSAVFAWSGTHCDEGDYDRLGRGDKD